MAATAVPVSAMTAAMQEKVEQYPCAVYEIGSTTNPLAAVIQALGVSASYLGRCGQLTVATAGQQSVAFLIPMDGTDYHIEASAQDTEGADVTIRIDWSSRTANGFDIYCQVVDAEVHWSTRKHTD